MPDQSSTTELRVVPLRARMTVAEYDTERAKLHSAHAASSVDAVATQDQGLAALFDRSGWTHDELARKEGKSQNWIALHSLFGCFLSFASTAANAETLPKDLTERRFRFYWEQTDQTEINDRVRFRAVIDLMRSERLVRARRPPIGKKIKEKFADGKWHRLSTIANALGVGEDHARATLEGFCKHQRYGCNAERKKVGTEFQYRIFKRDKTISSTELLAKLTPIIEGLKIEGRKTIVTMAPPVVARLAVQLERLLAEWTE